MEINMLVVFSFMVSNLISGFEALPQHENVEVGRQLKLVNKPAIKSFKTRHGDIFDCVDIHKQLAFDHPLLKNHSIQMRPTNDIAKQVRRPSSVWKTSQLLPKHMRCPEGTVLIKRVQKEDVELMKFTPSFVDIEFSMENEFDTNDGPGYHKIAVIAMPTENSGIHGIINLWQPEVKANQFSAAVIFVLSSDGPVNNFIAVGWLVQSVLAPNSTQLITYWTNDTGKTTGCFNTLCPGFVQISTKVTPGMIFEMVSTVEGKQFDVEFSIAQDATTKNWWFKIADENVGYFPKELFSKLANWADKGGWGGEISSPRTEGSPAMGSGHFPSEGFRKSCYIRQMTMINRHDQSVIFPNEKTILRAATTPQCYNVVYAGDAGQGSSLGHFMFFGGPPNCTW